jgi:hypothetical protein
MRTSSEINSIIRVNERSANSVSWLSRFTTEKENWFKQVHVIKDKAYLMLMSTKTDKKGIYILGSLEYNLDNLPNFIKRHIDFDLLEKAKGSLDYRAFGMYFRDGKLVKK